MSHREWWRDAVVHQIYPRSFADADGDGQVREHLGAAPDPAFFDAAVWVSR